MANDAATIRAKIAEIAATGGVVQYRLPGGRDVRRYSATEFLQLLDVVETAERTDTINSNTALAVFGNAR